ncbi:VWA domain-containing protein [Haloarcula nitratireducens]|uniref:VWA domain-containing protein n=1 Tax=Haloarcula nitratireducens TaxID=2487749 RepID=A0AAW4P6N0_9EURY|nr:VWA domain-containing protein [Halomicroarcula nitratireducens]MBX0293407.1 VWA domain-containing protein [Halomicroarcula nitratireducens]
MMVSYTLADGLRVGVEHLWPLAVLPVAVALLAYVVVWGEYGPRSASARSRRLLFGSRVLVVALLVVAAMGPYTVQTRETAGEPSVTLLADESASMAVYPNTTDSLVGDIEAEGVPVTRATVGSGNDSRLGDGIAANLRENGTVVVLSDGQVTDGRSLSAAAEEANALNATVSNVGISPTETERAVSIAGPQTVSAGLPTEFTVSLGAVEQPGPATVTVSVDGETVTTESVEAGESFTVSRSFNDTGTHRMTARVEGEDVYDVNDVYYRSVRVVEQPDLLYVSGGDYPLGEYLSDLYDVTEAETVPGDLDNYSAVVVQDRPANRLGNVSALQEHVIDGGGLVMVGGDNAYDNGGYEESPVASMLPVRVGNATGGTANIVLAIDVSGSSKEGLGVQKAVALDVLEQLGDENEVGVVAFNYRAFRVAELQQLGGNREAIADRIRRLQSGGATDIAVGLQGADELMGDEEGTIILLSDGNDYLGPPSAVANQLGREGTRIIGVGAAKRVNEQKMKRIASESGGSYFSASETDRLRLLFGGGSRRYEGQNLTIVTPDTFITSGVTLTANPGQANRVAVKSGADFQVATADGEPAIASWRFGLGRVVSVTAYDDDGTLGGLLRRPDSLVVTKSVNYAVGDPARTSTGVTAVSDARVGREATLTYRGENRPSAEDVSVRQVGENLYEGTFTPREVGYHDVLGTEYAANYPAEYGAFGRSQQLGSVVEATGGQTFAPDDGAAIARLARQQSTRVRTVRDSWGWLALLAALLVFLAEVVGRRVQVYRGRTTLESGLP